MSVAGNVQERPNADGEGLNERIHRILHPDADECMPILAYDRSLDACARDLLPVARERGWVGRRETDHVTGRERAWFYHHGRCDAAGANTTPTGEIARALCMAWLAGPGKDGGR